MLRESRETWVEVGITLDGTEQIPMRVDFRRVFNMKGVGLRLEFDNQANFLGGEVTDDYWIEPNGSITRGNFEFDKDGLISDADGSLSNIEKRKISIPHLVHKMISEKGLDDNIDPKKFL
jgi:hypothetical protein